MLEDKDLQKIREEVSKIFIQKLNKSRFWKKNRVTSQKGVKTRKKNDYKLLQMVTRQYLADQFAKLEGSVIIRRTKDDKKINLLFELLEKEKIFKNIDIKRLRSIKAFPIFEN